MKVQINHRLTGAILFECDAPGEMSSGMQMRHAAEKAAADRVSLRDADLRDADLRDADLRYANLRYANLRYANLRDADLRYADLSDADLRYADLSDADLRYANLRDADLRYANLRYANLRYANLRDADLRDADLRDANMKDNAKLIGERPIIQIGPIGSRGDIFTAYITNKGLRFDAGCQRQITREKFEERLSSEHGDNDHAKEYKAALALIDVHAEIWTPKDEKNA